MHFKVGIVIAASLLLVTVQPDHSCTRFIDLSEPCGCILSYETFDPICGSDGNTYLSTCFLECRNALHKIDIKMDYIGSCSQDSRCNCHAEYAPLCGSNGVTYSNECVLNCSKKKDHSIRVKYKGECGSGGGKRLPVFDKQQNKPGNCRCHSKLRSNYTRFGDRGQRYARSCGCRPNNEILLQTEHTTQPSSQPDVHSSCNDQQILKDSRSSSYEDKIVNLDTKKCVCAAMHKPVCGNNHHTYANFCVLHCSAKRNPGVELLRWGDCENIH